MCLQEKLKKIVQFVHLKDDSFMSLVVGVVEYEEILSFYMAGYQSVVTYLDVNFEKHILAVDTTKVIDWYKLTK